MFFASSKAMEKQLLNGPLSLSFFLDSWNKHVWWYERKWSFFKIFSCDKRSEEKAEMQHSVMIHLILLMPGKNPNDRFSISQIKVYISIYVNPFKIKLFCCCCWLFFCLCNSLRKYLYCRPVFGKFVKAPHHKVTVVKFPS